MLVGCNATEKDQLRVYSFEGENENFTVSNGIIVLHGSEEIFDGGKLNTTDHFFKNVISYTTTFYIASDKGKEVIMKNSVEDMTGEELNAPNALGRASGNSIINSKIDDYDLNNNLYFELVTRDKDNNEKSYQIQLILSEITKNDSIEQRTNTYQSRNNIYRKKQVIPTLTKALAADGQGA